MFDSGIYLYLRTVNAVDIIIHYQKMAKEKFYVVWEGVTPGVYASWTDCQLQIKGYEGAKYKSFDTREEAERALTSSPYAYIGKNAKKKTEAARTGSDTLPASVIDNSLAVDAACSGNPGPMEYRGVHVASRQEIFHFGPMKGTNNIGEFLAIVHGLALLKQKGFDMPIYSDSVNAISWVRQKKCKTKLPRNEETEELFKVIERAEKWLRENTYTTRILKWETKVWGEIPADFLLMFKHKAEHQKISGNSHSEHTQRSYLLIYIQIQEQIEQSHMYQIVHQMAASKSQSPFQRRVATKREIRSQKEITDKTRHIAYRVGNIQVGHFVFLQQIINPIMYSGGQRSHRAITNKLVAFTLRLKY